MLPKDKTEGHLLELAKRGAKAQLQDLLHEINMLVELFPHLKDSVDRDELPVGFLLKRGARRAATQKKRTISAAGRRAISQAQKRRWAAQKAAKSGGK